MLGGGASGGTLSRADWSPRGVFGFNSHDSRSRPFNLLRSQVLKIMQNNNWRIVGVTSATPNVGKSFVASNLAASLSRIPSIHTLLFDFDLRRGSIAKTFEIEEGFGIESFLLGKINSLGDAAREVADTRMTIFPAFTTEHSSAELLAGSRMRTLVQAMKNLPDNMVCICDLPPAFANDDSAIVLREIDAFIFVVEEGKNTVKQVRDAIDLLQPTPCLGTVLNRYRGGFGGDDYGFGYGTNRGYEAYYS
ncbi:CpsD/CapB family tyrosine-protein kinase [Sphingomonas sp.]|uniref:CpsD/CapB family tyrosine-protein kinase n=1 Tax=Sphingomonas sp. TaxID=28214 RepID=UPI001B040549|nr:CpsD/CapB family tyrosine-protein kinase [Sphingomonas sp.]MBO9714538.1 CpsD/CapB family tyrosine-protein kinase [Sphingomonas sp.]